MKFPSAKSFFVNLTLWGAVVLLMVVSIQTILRGGSVQFMVIILALVIGLLIWMLTGTYYVIEGRELRYRSGPINGKINIDSIRKIEVGKTQFAGLKPALASNGCVICYNKFDEIYVSPKDKPLFVAELKKINPAIAVTGQM